MIARRAFVIVTVLVVVTIVLLIVTSTLFLAQAEMAGAAAAQESGRGRRLAWSGVQAVMTQLEGQRDRVLTGAVPFLDTEIMLYEDGGRAGVVRLVPIGLDGDHLVPEAGKLDLNRVDGPMLVATGLVDAATADAIITHRTNQRGGVFQSVAELLAVDTVTAETLYGPLDELVDLHASAIAPGDGGDGLRSRTPRGLADVVTVFAHEPALQRSGVKRIALNGPWSDTLGERLDERFGAGAGDAVKAIMDNGTQFESEGRIFEVLNFFGTSTDDWPDIVDTITADEGSFHVGRLDLNTATAEALATLPGLDRELASQIVARRGALSDDRRSTIAWPVLEDIVPRSAYPELASWITTRSFLYRVRLVAGEIDLDDPDERIVRPVVLEAVIDLSETGARLAYLRDVTVWPATVGLLAAESTSDEETRRPSRRRDTAGAAAYTSGVEDDGLEPTADLDLTGDFPSADSLDFNDLSLSPSRDREPMETPADDSSAMPARASSGQRSRVARWLAGPARSEVTPELR